MALLSGFAQPIESDLPIPGALARFDRCDLAAQPLSVRLTASGSDDREDLYRRDGEALIFSPPGVGQYRCLPDRIDVAPNSACDNDELTALLIATALPATQWMQGSFVLHASAVVLPGRSGAIAIAGVSGSGKSTVAAAMLSRGANLLADDSLRIMRHADGWRAAGLPGGLFVNKANGMGRRFEPVGPDRAVHDAGLDAILVLGKGEATKIERLERPDAVGRLLAMQHRPRIPAFLELRREVLNLAAEMARSVPVFHWQRHDAGLALEQQEWNMILECCGER